MELVYGGEAVGDGSGTTVLKNMVATALLGGQCGEKGS